MSGAAGGDEDAVQRGGSGGVRLVGDIFTSLTAAGQDQDQSGETCKNKSSAFHGALLSGGCPVVTVNRSGRVKTAETPRKGGLRCLHSQVMDTTV